MDIKQLVQSYSPWITEESQEEWARLRKSIPEFHRPVFHEIVKDVCTLNQIVSVIGPRRVGKSTLLRQLVQHLIETNGVSPNRIIYYSLDDPALYGPGRSGAEMIDALMGHMAELGKDGPAYLLLDEIQTLERWELYLKKYYDLNYPVKVVISGSASSPIFKKSRESLLGRVKDYHVLPFSFREYLLFQASGEASLIDEMESIKTAGEAMMGMLSKNPNHFDTQSVRIDGISDELWKRAEDSLRKYFVDGGFPEVWNFDTQEKKMEYLFDNQVKKVITEDLVLAVELRKPEQLKIFYISLLEYPGREVSMSKLSQEIGIDVQQIQKYLPLLEMTDLIRHAGKFRKSAVRFRKGYQKFYPIDLALRNAVLRIGPEILDNPSMLGLYAETLVFNAIKKWPGILQVDYYRNKQKEVDFIIHTSPQQYLPIEVKYSSGTGERELKGLQEFCSQYRCSAPILVTRKKEDFGQKAGASAFHLPLILFLLLFD